MLHSSAILFASITYIFISLSIIVFLTLFGKNLINSSPFLELTKINVPPFFILSTISYLSKYESLVHTKRFAFFI